MSETLVIYDNEGQIFRKITGSFIIPTGLQHIITIIPEGKRLVGVNVETHEPIFEDIPPTEIDKLKQQNQSLIEQVDATSADLQAFMEYYFTNGGV